MTVMQSYMQQSKVVTDAQVRFCKIQEKPSEQYLWTVLDDPSFRRLLRDGHRADATVDLLTQLQDNE